MDYYVFLRSIHELLRPEAYLEIGVASGASLALADCRSVGIDPAYSIRAELNNDIALFRTSSDEYFSRPDPLAATGGRLFDLALIDGLHLFEFALRDFIYTEGHSSAKSMIVFDDVLPRSVDEAARVRHTHGWTGDVYPMIEVLARFRPELNVLPVGTTPTGLLLVTGLDPSSTALADNYQRILDEYRKPDPQPVPAELLDRLSILSPRRVIESSFWEVLAGASSTAEVADIRAQLGPRLRSSLGPAFDVPSLPT